MPLIKKIKKPEIPIISVKKFHERKDKILIVRETGGLGDILMHRMMFEDFKKIMPNAEITFACPLKYHEAVKDHPFIDKVIDSKYVDTTGFAIYYNTTGACSRYEMAAAPFAYKNRSDIWANHCGVPLTEHKMHFQINPQALEYGQKALKQFVGNGPIAILAPISAMLVKNLSDKQMWSAVSKLRSEGCSVVALHTKPIYELQEMDVPTLYGLNLEQWIGIIAASDYIVSVDTSTFHMAGGLGKPLVGIFTFADGKVYGKWYPHFVLVQKHRDNGDWSCGPCYNWAMCPKTKKIPKPCLTEITKEMIQTGIDKMFEKFPISALNK